MGKQVRMAQETNRKQYDQCSDKSSHKDPSDCDEEQDCYNSFTQDYDEYCQPPRIQTLTDLSQLHQTINTTIQEICEATQLPKYCTIMHLQQNRFCKEWVLEKIGQLLQKQGGLMQIEGECAICNENKQLLQPNCGHAFCIRCLQEYLKVYYKGQQPKELFARCMYQSCRQTLKWNHLQLACQDQRVSSYFHSLLCKKYAQKSNNVVQCTRLSCQAYTLTDCTERVVVCRCGNEMCRICKDENHFPLTCQQNHPKNNIFHGLLKANDQTSRKSSITLFIDLQVQICPSCKIPISKDAGCLKMACSCGFKFCWNCLQEWTKHNSYYFCSKERVQTIDMQDEELYPPFGKQKMFNLKFRILKKMGREITFLQNLNIEGIIQKLTEFQIPQIRTRKLYEIRNLLVSLYRFFFNYEVISYSPNFQAHLRQEKLMQIKSMAYALSKLLCDHYSMDNCCSLFMRSEEVEKVNDLVSITRQLYEYVKTAQFYTI